MTAGKGAQFYEIKVKGHLDDHWSRWFDDLTVVQDEHGNTTLSGPVTDQAALHGLLKKVHNLGLELLSVQRMAPRKAPRKAPRIEPQDEASGR